MKVLNLQCDNRHGFEGWFVDQEAFEHQQANGLVECPVCSSHTVIKMLSAPRLNMGASPPQPSGKTSTSHSHSTGDTDSEAIARWQSHAREVVAKTENVGERFASEARAMHDGELPQRPIRGVASAAEVKDLISEGIGILPVPSYLVEPLH